MINNSCCVLNTDNSRGGGVHWVALVKDNGQYIFYDSFGRDADKLSPDFLKDWKETNPNQEQKLIELNCGMRCVAFLKCCDLFGVNSVKKII